MSRLIDLTGKRFHRLVVVEHSASTKYRQPIWKCICDCGNETYVLGLHLRRGAQKSCGCLQKENRFKHGLSRKYLAECSIWRGMMIRCYDATYHGFDRYGGRGIKVCERWHDINNFIADMGKRPSSLLSLERMNNDCDYSPENCIWATAKEQQNNTRRNHKVTFRGQTKTISQWSDENGWPWHVLGTRLSRGWSVERAMTTPRKAWHRHVN